MDLRETLKPSSRKIILVALFAIIIHIVSQSTLCLLCVGCPCLSLYMIEKSSPLNYVISGIINPIILYLLLSFSVFRPGPKKNRKLLNTP